MRFSQILLGLLLVFLFGRGGLAAPKVVASIAPLHSIAAAVLQDVGEPTLLLDNRLSPHFAHLKPSHAALLESADLILWIGPGLETFLERPIAALSEPERVLTFADVPDIVHQSARRAGGWTANEPVDSHDDGGHSEAEKNMHLWLDPANGRVMARAIAERLTLLDPDHAETYAANASTFEEQLSALEGEIEARLAPWRDRPYLVLHDAYRAFETRFDLSPRGAFSIVPERSPGPRRLAALRQLVRTESIACIFIEPGLEPPWLESIFDGEPVRLGLLDPLGVRLAPGTDLYPRLLNDLSHALHDCLSQ